MRYEDHNLHSTGTKRHVVFDMPGSGWEAVTGVPCPVRGCKQTVVWYEAGYVPGYRVCMREVGDATYDQTSIKHRFMAGIALGCGSTLICDTETESF